MKRTSILILTLFCAIVIFWGCESKQKEDLQLKEVTIGVQNSSVSSLIFIAQQKGYFQENGLDIKI